ncbi:MAG TPA: acyl-CoA dehydrogenase family protein [Syntrophomonas sp.]|nr:acyl-CoA dehydrogenase family protein [Syntrophomonas sp.]
MDFRLNKEDQLIQKMAKDFAEKTVAPIAKQIHETNEVPMKVLKEMGELGLFGISIEEKYGGGGTGFEKMVLALEQIARVSTGLGTIMGVHTMAVCAINFFAPQPLKDEYLPKLAKGELFGAFAFTEPGTGSDPKQITTTAIKNGDFYVINGTKRFISSPNLQGPMVVFARESETQEVTAFLIDKFCEGYSTSQPWSKIGYHGSHLCDIYLKDVRVPKERIMGEVGKGFNILLLAIATGKIGTSTVALGSILACYEEAVKYAKEKMHRNAPIAKFQAIQLKIARIATLYRTASLLCYQLGQNANDIKDPNWFAKEAALVKGYVSDVNVQAAQLAMDVHGSYGLMDDYDICRYYGDAIIAPQIEGVSDMQRIILASSILK